ncbi:hypothetical protein C6988_04675 [Nitrosopumilus sp. b1]|nr:hypothetical protein C6988_04675 [Nitrosopumilus sp. b1]
MDKILENKMNEKINEVFLNSSEISSIVNLLDKLSSNRDSFAYGIFIGRLYNSFYYQCRRILKRNPTEEEFSEFVEMLKSREKEFLKLVFP